MTGGLAALAATYAVGTAACVFAFVWAQREARRRRLPLRAVSLTLIGLCSYPLVLVPLKYLALRYYADLTVWCELCFRIANGQGAISELEESLIRGTRNWYASHFTPFVYPLGKLFAFCPHPLFLLISQLLFFAAILWAFYRYAARKLTDSESALAMTAIFALFPTLQYIQLYEFELLRFCILPLLLAYDALDRGALRYYWVWCAVAVLIREEVALTVAAMGIVAAFRMRRPVLGSITAMGAVAYFLVVMEIVMPAHRGPGIDTHVAFSFFAALGTTLPEILRNALLKPALVASIVLKPMKLANLFMYLLPLGFAPLLAPDILLITAANVGPNLLSESVVHTSYLMYYLAPAIPFFFIACVEGLPRLEKFLGTSRSAAIAGLLACSFSASVFFGPTPWSLQFWLREYRVAPFRTQDFHWSSYVPTHHNLLGRKMSGLIPLNAHVCAEQPLLPLLYDRDGISVFPDLRSSDWAFIDRENPNKTGVLSVPDSWDGLRLHPQYYYDWVEKDPAWRKVAEEDGYAIFTRERRNRA